LEFHIIYNEFCPICNLRERIVVNNILDKLKIDGRYLYPDPFNEDYIKIFNYYELEEELLKLDYIDCSKNVNLKDVLMLGKDILNKNN
jgi:hypothetical protein